MKKLSAYEQIKANITIDGKLPHDFTLEEKPAPNQIGYIPGAMDGIGVFHMSSSRNEKKTIKKIGSLFKKYFKTDSEKYIGGIERLLTDNRAISMIDSILEDIRIDHESIDLNKVVALSLNLIKTSDNIELIKIGIGLLGLFDLGGFDEAIETVITLALYDDFTLYTVVAALGWTDGNKIIFQMAKHVDGWGKIHAVERLEPIDDEIRDWILRDGCSNNVMNAYLGLTCAVKGDLINALRQDNLDDDLFESISVILDALLDEGPVTGISAYEHAEEALNLFLNHAKKYAVSVKHLWQILNIRDWAGNAEVGYKNRVLVGCNDIISNPNWESKIFDALKQRDDKLLFYVIYSASRMDIDISVELLAAVKAEPLKNHMYIQPLFKVRNMADELISFYENILPLDEMAAGMGDYMFPDKLIQEYSSLDFILPEVATYSLQGIKLIKTGLNSPVVRNRTMACRALSGWVKSQNKPLAEISPELYGEISRIYKIEVNEHTKATMKKLIDGGFEEYD